MAGRRLRTAPEHLVEGLTFDERLSRLESAIRGTKYAAGLEREHEETRRRVEDIEHAHRQQALPWYLRWFVNRKGATS